MEDETKKESEDNNEGLPDFKFVAQTDNADKKNEFLSPVDKVIFNIYFIFTSNNAFIIDHYKCCLLIFF